MAGSKTDGRRTPCEDNISRRLWQGELKSHFQHSFAKQNSHQQLQCFILGPKNSLGGPAYHHGCCEFECRTGRGVQHYVIKFVSDL
jgi:hypothetical protein